MSVEGEGEGEGVSEGVSVEVEVKDEEEGSVRVCAEGEGEDRSGESRWTSRRRRALAREVCECCLGLGVVRTWWGWWGEQNEKRVTTVSRGTDQHGNVLFFFVFFFNM